MFALRPIIGLVGGIAAGKSHVASLFDERGCRVIDSDALVRIAYTHPAVKRAVGREFGADVLDERGVVDRAAISRIVFEQPDKRRWLEELIHPAVNKARVELMEQAANDDRVRAYVWDSPLLIETGLDRLCDAVVFVDAPAADRAKRATGRGWSGDELARREKAQMPLDKKRGRAEYVLANADAEPATGETVESVLQAIVDKTAPESACCGGHCGSGGCGSQGAGGACGCQSPSGDARD